MPHYFKHKLNTEQYDFSKDIPQSGTSLDFIFFSSQFLTSSSFYLLKPQQYSWPCLT